MPGVAGPDRRSTIRVRTEREAEMWARALCLLGVVGLLGAGCGPECASGAARCDGDRPVNCYREHNASDEFDDPAWHEGEPCQPGYSCVIEPRHGAALCVYGGAPYPGCPPTPSDDGHFPQAVCEDELLVRCDGPYRLSDEACTTCDPYFNPDSQMYGASCTERSREGGPCDAHEGCLSELCVDGGCVRPCRSEADCDPGDRCEAAPDLWSAYCRAGDAVARGADAPSSYAQKSPFWWQRPSWRQTSDRRQSASEPTAQRPSRSAHWPST